MEGPGGGLSRLFSFLVPVVAGTWGQYKSKTVPKCAGPNSVNAGNDLAQAAHTQYGQRGV